MNTPRIAIVGAGVVGALVAFLCGQLPGADVKLVDINPRRAELAKALGVRFAEPAEAAGDCDLVVHASGSPDGLRTAIELAMLCVLSRRPREEELRHFESRLADAKSGQRSARLGDLYWTLLNSTEFSWNH